MLTPFHKVVNRAPYHLMLQHENHHTWFRLRAGECVGLWPDSTNRAVRVRVEGMQEATAPVAYDFLHSTLFRLENKYGGVHAEAIEEESGGGILLTLDR